MALIGLVGKIGSGKDTVASIVQELYPELNWQVKGFADKLRQIVSLLTGIPTEDMKRQEVKDMVLSEEWNYFTGGYRIDGISYDHGPFKSEKDFIDTLPSSAYSEVCIETEMTLRMLLIEIGMKIREVNKNAWVNALMCNYKEVVFKHTWHRGDYWGTCGKCDEKFIGHKLQRVCEPCCNIEHRSWPNWLVCDTRFQNEHQAIISRQGICVRIIRPNNPFPQSSHESETALNDVKLLTIVNNGSIEQLRLRVKEVFDPILENGKV